MLRFFPHNPYFVGVPCYAYSMNENGNTFTTETVLNPLAATAPYKVARFAQVTTHSCGSTDVFKHYSMFAGEVENFHFVCRACGKMEA